MSHGNDQSEELERLDLYRCRSILTRVEAAANQLQMNRERRREGGVKGATVCPDPLRLEPVPHAGLGPQVSGRGRVRLELAAQLGDVDAEVGDLVDVLRPPHLVEQVTLGHHASGRAQERFQQAPLRRGEVHTVAVALDASGGAVDPLLMTSILLGGGTLFVTAAEWTNPGTLGTLDAPGRVLAGFFQAVMPRTAGFNSVDISAMNTGTLLGSDVLMFIGGGSAGTAGGIKVGTFAVLLLAITAELRGDPDVDLFDRRLSPAVIRQALAVALLSVAVVVVSTMVIAMTSTYALDQVLYEVISAFATVGLSTGITARLAAGHQILLVVLMFAGRLGPVTLASALVLRERQRLVRRPEGRPLIG